MYSSRLNFEPHHHPIRLGSCFAPEGRRHRKITSRDAPCARRSCHNNRILYFGDINAFVTSLISQFCFWLHYRHNNITFVFRLSTVNRTERISYVDSYVPFPSPAKAPRFLQVSRTVRNTDTASYTVDDELLVLIHPTNIGLTSTDKRSSDELSLEILFS